MRRKMVFLFIDLLLVIYLICKQKLKIEVESCESIVMLDSRNIGVNFIIIIPSLSEEHQHARQKTVVLALRPAPFWFPAKAEPFYLDRCPLSDRTQHKVSNDCFLHLSLHLRTGWIYVIKKVVFPLSLRRQPSNKRSDHDWHDRLLQKNIRRSQRKSYCSFPKKTWKGHLRRSSQLLYLFLAQRYGLWHCPNKKISPKNGQTLS